MNERLRVGDADRERAAADLGEHYAEGRLTLEEHAERLDRIWAARTGADLAPVFADLPARTVATPATPPARRGPAARGGPSAPVLALAAVLVVVSVFTHLPLILLALVLFVLVRHHRRRNWLPSGS